MMRVDSDLRGSGADRGVALTPFKGDILKGTERAALRRRNEDL